MEILQCFQDLAPWTGTAIQLHNLVKTAISCHFLTWQKLLRFDILLNITFSKFKSYGSLARDFLVIGKLINWEKLHTLFQVLLLDLYMIRLKAMTLVVTPL